MDACDSTWEMQTAETNTRLVLIFTLELEAESCTAVVRNVCSYGGLKSTADQAVCALRMQVTMKGYLFSAENVPSSVTC